MLLLLIAQSKTLAAYTCIFFFCIFRAAVMYIIVLWVSFFTIFSIFFTLESSTALTDTLYLFCVRFGLVAGQDSRAAVGYESFLGICPRIKL